MRKHLVFLLFLAINFSYMMDIYDQDVNDSNLYDMQEKFISGMDLLRRVTKCENTYFSLLPWTVVSMATSLPSLGACASNLSAYESDR